MVNTFLIRSLHAELYLYIRHHYSGNAILWKFSIIQESGILSVKVILLSRDYGHWSQAHVYKYIQNELIEKSKRMYDRVKRNVTIQKRKSHNREKNVSVVVNACIKFTLKKGYVFIQNLTSVSCNVSLIL